MKKILFPLFFCLTFTMPVNSQVTISASSEEVKVIEPIRQIFIDTCTLRVQYRMWSIDDVKNTDKKSNYLMLLQVGKRISKFSDYYMLKADSLHNAYASQKMNEVIAINKIMQVRQHTSRLNVYKNYPAEKISTYDRIPFSGNFYYTEDYIIQNWKLTEKTATICGYLCKSATTTFRGRNYTAWYTEKVPVSDGPWKFSGLPGLILQIADDKNEYRFECIGIEKGKKTERIYVKNKDDFKTTRDAFNKQMKDALYNPDAAIETSRMVVRQNSSDKSKSKSIPYNPIELE